MGAEHSSALTFNLEETVWLDKSQNMKELLSLGLEPDIRIEEKADYVAIKGGLHLRGEYTQGEQAREEIESESESDIPAHQYVQGNEQENSGVGEIKHYFPVDVTIPLHRIHNLDDVYVQIEGFDYDLPEPGCIQLTADVSISGMKKEDEPSPEKTKAEVVSVPEPMPRFDMEAKKTEEEAKEGSPPEEKRFPKEKVSLEEDSAEEFWEENNEKAEAAFVAEQNQKELNELSRNEPSEEGTPEEDWEENGEEVHEPREEIREEEIEEEESLEEENKAEEENDEIEEETTSIVTAFHSRPSHQEDNTIEEQPIEIAEEESEKEKDNSITAEEDTESTSGRYDNALYLTKVMTQGEEEFSKIKMCIIQEDESLDTIAERYGTTISHLIRFNRLDNEHVEEGQILYIPASAVGRKQHEQ